VGLPALGAGLDFNKFPNTFQTQVRFIQRFLLVGEHPFHRTSA